VTKFNMTSAWNDASALLQADRSLTLVIAGAFLFLPALAFNLIGPIPVEPPPNADLAMLAKVLSDDLSRMLPWLVIVSVVSSVGGVAILRLWLAEESISVGEALTFALSLVPVIIVVYVLQGVAVGLAAMALLIPAFYVSGRLAPVLPLLAAGETRGPLNVLERAWAITKGNGWRIAAMLILVQIVLVLVSMLVEGAGGLLGARGTLGGAIGAAANAVVAAAMALVTYAVSASVYRQLSYGSAVRTFE
jgi:hypothetical protein